MASALLGARGALAGPQPIILHQQAGIDGSRISGDGTALTFLSDYGLYAHLAHRGSVTALFDPIHAAGGPSSHDVRAPVSGDRVLLSYQLDVPAEEVGEKLDFGVFTRLYGLDQYGASSPHARLFDASADGSVVVGVGGNGVGNRWDGTTPSLLPPLPGTIVAVPRSISADGSVIGGYNVLPPGTSTSAVRWEGGGAPNALPSLSGTGFHGVLDVSADGTTLVGQSEGLEGSRAVRWVGTQLEPLGTPGSATSVNFDGHVIVGQSNGEPFIWIEDGDVRNLNAYLRDQTDAELGTFVIDEASVADDGITFGGIGHFTEPEGPHAADVETAFILQMGSLPLPVRPSLPLGGPPLALTLAAAIGAIGARRLGRGLNGGNPRSAGHTELDQTHLPPLDSPDGLHPPRIHDA